ncbi:hypothetical protein U3516DRAFT_674316 [Neocallimastix sp. 'constans']
MILNNAVVDISQNDNIIPNDKIIFKKKNKYDIKEIYKLNNNKLQIDYINQFNNEKLSSTSSLVSSNSSQSINQGTTENKPIKNNLRNLKNTNYLKKNQNIHTKRKNKLKLYDKKIIKSIKSNITSGSSSSLDSSISSSSLTSLERLSDKVQTSLPPLIRSNYSCLDFSLEKKR